ncbi:MAG: hypothetical protein KF718_10830 [Polyangiaceae bacterium]|nr:hypothetical protein [Polyangiaceae bacterium]
MSVGVAGKVKCDDNLECSLTSGGGQLAQKCCWNSSTESGSCALSVNSCTSPLTTIRCDSKNDCSSGQVCCYTRSLLVSPTMPSATCQDTCPSGTQIGVTRFELCAPAPLPVLPCGINASCVPVTNNPYLPAGYHRCQ